MGVDCGSRVFGRTRAHALLSESTMPTMLNINVLDHNIYECVFPSKMHRFRIRALPEFEVPISLTLERISFHVWLALLN